MNHLHEPLTTRWLKDGDADAYVMRINPTGAANVGYVLTNPLGRIPAGVQITKKNMAVDCFVDSADTNKITVKFTLDNADLNLRVW